MDCFLYRLSNNNKKRIEYKGYTNRKIFFTTSFFNEELQIVACTVQRFNVCVWLIFFPVCADEKKRFVYFKFYIY